jgi:hypothetical protein
MIEIAAAIGEEVQRLYRDDRDVDAMLSTAVAGIAYCEKHAAAEPDEHKRRELLRLARSIGFNAAANCWPGWDDPGVRIEPSHVIRGLDIAQHSEALAQELDLPPRNLGGAIWLTGALHLANGERQTARTSFERAERTFLTDPELAAYALMARGYVALADAMEPLGRDAAGARLESTFELLRADGSKDAAFFIDQLATAKRVLER